MHPELQGRALARGDRRLTAQIQATGKLPSAVREWAGAAYPTSKAPAAAADELLLLLTAQPGSISSGAIAKLLTSAGSADAVPQAYDPALCTALEQMVLESLQKRKHTLDDLWFMVGLLQHRLLQAAGGDVEMEALLLGPGTLTTEHLK